ncbi:YheC/YheD family protein [Gorillibacterium sp. CAU 1737]|uniref:YheC/YheD family endospore coat-associated protein n=1 Tax=Gorillibacterium sp. CAU 1737 TaxID=3140362 RepID=UPI00326055DC
MADPTLGIMTLYQKDGTLDEEERTYFRSLVLQGEELGLHVFVFTPEDVDPSGTSVRAHVYDREKGGWSRAPKPLPDAVYDRCRSQQSPKFRLMRSFRTQYPKLLYLNHPLSSKWGNHVILNKDSRIRPHLPLTRRFHTLGDLKEFTALHRIVYIKPVDGSGGRGIARVTRNGDGQLALSGRDASRAIIQPLTGSPEAVMRRLSGWITDRRYLIQQGIPLTLKDGRVHDIRLLIQKNASGHWQVTGAAGRIGAKGSATSNLHGGGEAVSFHRLMAARGFSEAKTAAIRNDMEALGRAIALRLEGHFGRLCELALDLAVDPAGHVWLIEVNPKPSREVFKRIGDQAAYTTALRRPLEYALFLI